MSTSGFIRAQRAIGISIAIAVGSAIGVLAVSAPFDGRADATTLTCTTGVSTSNALGAATGWTEFVEQNGTRTSESEGSIAYGGDLSHNGGMPVMDLVGNDLGSAPAPATPTLVVHGTHGTFNLHYGSAYVLGSTGVDFKNPSPPPNRYLTSSPVDFGAAFTDLRAKSTAWGSAAATGTITLITGNTPNKPGGQDTLVLSGTNADLNVFTLNSGTLGNLQVGIDVPQGSTVLINVTGTSVSFNNRILIKEGSSWNQTNDSVMKPGWGTAGWAGVLWNFPTATSVTNNVGAAFGGTILAPNATVNGGNSGHTIGQIIAKNFNSGIESHFNLFPSTACLPRTSTPPTDPDPSDVTITKSASALTPHGGAAVTYTLTAKNVGASPANGVVIRDALPSGVTFVSATSPCAQTAGVVTCNVGTLNPGESTSVRIAVLANPIAGAGPSSHPQANHWMTPAHYETQVDLEAGEQKSVTLSCPAGGILSDGQFRMDHVDQDTGSIAGSVKVLSSQSIGIGSWTGMIRNDATGRAQAKAFIVCLPAKTDPSDSQNGSGNAHQHALSADAALVTDTATYTGLNTAVLTCPPGTIPVAPGFDQPATGMTLVGSEFDTSHPRDWTFTLDAPVPTTTTLSVRCLRTAVSSYGGHTHELRFVHVVQTVTVPGHTAKEGDEFQVICPDDAKGIVATWNLPPGVKHFGNDPRIKTRAFRLFNNTGAPKQATLDLLCLRDRTTSEEMGTTNPLVVLNTATVESTSQDANEFNNSASASIKVQPGSSTTALLASGKVAGSAFSMKVVSSMPGKGAMTVRADGAVLARGQVSLRPGKASTARLKLTPAGVRKLAKLDKVTVSVDPTRGRVTTRNVTVRH